MKNSHISLEDTKLKNNFFGIFTSTQGLQFTNQCVISFRFTNLLVCFFPGPPSWPCGSSCRGGVTRKDASWLNYFAFVQPLFQLYKTVSDYKEKFHIEKFSKIYKYFQKSILEQICSVPNRNTLQMSLQIFNKLPVSLNII